MRGGNKCVCTFAFPVVVVVVVGVARAWSVAGGINVISTNARGKQPLIVALRHSFLPPVYLSRMLRPRVEITRGKHAIEKSSKWPAAAAAALRASSCVQRIVLHGEIGGVAGGREGGEWLLFRRGILDSR